MRCFPTDLYSFRGRDFSVYAFAFAVLIQRLQPPEPHGHAFGQLDIFKVHKQTGLIQVPGVFDLIPAVLGFDKIRRDQGDHVPAVPDPRGNRLVPFRTGNQSLIIPYPEAHADHFTDQFLRGVGVPVRIAQKDIWLFAVVRRVFPIGKIHRIQLRSSELRAGASETARSDKNLT